jgi:protein O-mannosyl-transferase
MPNISRIQKYFFATTAVLIAFFTYSNHFNNPFEFDDEHTIVTNQSIRSLVNIPTFFMDATTTSTLPENQAYRPGLTTLNAIDYAIGGEELPNPFYYHLSIFISFIVLGLVFFSFCKKLLAQYFNDTTTFIGSLLATLFLWVHTANSATINYIIQRADSFSTLMVLVAFLMYVHLPKLNKYHLYLLPVIIGFSVKEPALMFVPLLFVYKLLFEQKTKTNPISLSNITEILKISKALLFPLIAVLIIFIFSRQMTPDKWTSGNNDAFGYLLTQFFVILHYFSNFFVPYNLTIDSDWKIIPLPDLRIFVGLAFILGLLVTIFKTATKHRPIAFGLAWFLIALAPSSSIFPFAEIMNDHRPFFAYMGLFITSAYLFSLLFQYSKPILIAISLLLFTCHIVGTYQQNIKWQSVESLWEDATRKAPNNPRTWLNYANALLPQKKYEAMEIAYQKAIAINPNYAYPYLNVGIIKGLRQQNEEAELYFKKALELDKNSPEAYYYYAEFLSRINRLPEATNYITKGLAISPKHTRLNELKTELEKRINSPAVYQQERIIRGEEFVKLYPTTENYLSLSLEYYKVGNFQKCIEACEIALKINPNYALAYNNICAAYNELKQWEKATKACQKGLLLDTNNEMLKANLQRALSNLMK